MFGKIDGKGDAPASPIPSIKPDVSVDIGQNTIVEPVPTDSQKKEEGIQENKDAAPKNTEEPMKEEKKDEIAETEEEVSPNADAGSTIGENKEEKTEKEQQPEENTEGEQKMENENNVGVASVSISGGGGGVEIGGDTGGMGNMGGADAGTESGTAVVPSLLNSVPFMLEITGITAVLAIIIGILLAVRKIKKGFELYED